MSIGWRGIWEMYILVSVHTTTRGGILFTSYACTLQFKKFKTCGIDWLAQCTLRDVELEAMFL